MSFLIKKSRAFSLIEALVYVGVLIIITYSLESFIFWTIDSNAKSRAMKETLDNARRSMETMVYEVREAKGVYTPTSIFDNDSGQLSLETTHNLPSGETTTYLNFYLCDKHLCLKREGANPITITTNDVSVDRLIFSRSVASSTELVQITLALKYNAPVSQLNWQASTTLVTTSAVRGY